MKNMLKQTAKKIYKSGMFYNFKMEQKYLSFMDCDNNLYVIQPFKELWLFRIGKPFTYEVLQPTYESEYNQCGMVEHCRFVDNVKPTMTDNPDYILRASLSYVLCHVNP